MTKQRVAIVTGAGSGVGRATAVALAQSGWAVVLVGRTASKLVETEALIRDAVGDAVTLAHPADVSDERAIDRLVKDTLAFFGRIDAVANVAGDAPYGPLHELSTDTYRRCMGVNLDAVIFLTRAVWPTFAAQQRGVVCNVSSLASVDPFPGFNAYAAAKAGVNLLTRATANEGRGDGIRAVAIAPGAIETAMLRENFDEQMLPRDKTLSPQAVARVIVDCLVGTRRFESGETILLPSP